MSVKFPLPLPFLRAKETALSWFHAGRLKSTASRAPARKRLALPVRWPTFLHRLASRKGHPATTAFRGGRGACRPTPAAPRDHDGAILPEGG